MKDQSRKRGKWQRTTPQIGVGEGGAGQEEGDGPSLGDGDGGAGILG